MDAPGGLDKKQRQELAVNEINEILVKYNLEVITYLDVRSTGIKARLAFQDRSFKEPVPKKAK